MKKNILLSIIITAIVIVAIVIVFLALKPKAEDEGDSYDQNIKILNDTHPTKIYVLGDEIQFRPELKFEKINSISEFSSKPDQQKYERIVLIVNDESGELTLADEAYNTILNAIESGTTDFYYIGSNKIDELISHGIWKGEIGEDDLGVGTSLYYHAKSYFKGFWTQYDVDMTQGNEEALGMIIVSQIIRCIKSNY